MPLLTPQDVAAITPVLRLQAKLQSLKWKDNPEELDAFFRNLKSFIYKSVQSHGGYQTHVTTFTIGDTEFCRFTLKSINNPKFIPTIEAFIDPHGKIYFHIVWTAIGTRDTEVDDYIAKHFVNYICQAFDEPDNQIAIIIHRRWKLNLQDTQATYDCVEWGNIELCKLAHVLIRKQQAIARRLILKHRESIDRLAIIQEALQTTPTKDDLS